MSSNLQNVHQIFIQNFCQTSGYLTVIRGSAEIKVGGNRGIWFCDNRMIKISDGLHVNNLTGYFRSSHQKFSIKIGVLKNIAKSKHLFYRAPPNNCFWYLIFQLIKNNAMLL